MIVDLHWSVKYEHIFKIKFVYHFNFLKCYIAYIARFLGQQYQNICPSVTGRIVFAYYVNYNLQWEIFIEFILKIKIVYFEMMNLRILRYRKGRYCIFSLSRINLLLDVFFLKYCELNLDVDQVYDVLTNHDTTMTAPGIIYYFTTCISHCERRTSKYHAHGNIRWI